MVQADVFATIMLSACCLCGDGVLGVFRGAKFAPDMEFSLMAKKFSSSLT